jgi:hypothetical protein
MFLKKLHVFAPKKTIPFEKLMGIKHLYFCNFVFLKEIFNSIN